MLKSKLLQDEEKLAQKKSSKFGDVSICLSILYTSFWKKIPILRVELFTVEYTLFVIHSFSTQMNLIEILDPWQPKSAGFWNASFRSEWLYDWEISLSVLTSYDNCFVYAFVWVYLLTSVQLNCQLHVVCHKLPINFSDSIICAWSFSFFFNFQRKISPPRSSRRNSCHRRCVMTSWFAMKCHKITWYKIKVHQFHCLLCQWMNA